MKRKITVTINRDGKSRTVAMDRSPRLGRMLYLPGDSRPWHVSKVEIPVPRRAL